MCWWVVVGVSRAGVAVILVTESSLLLPTQSPSLPRGRPEATYGHSFRPPPAFGLLFHGWARKFETSEWVSVRWTTRCHEKDQANAISDQTRGGFTKLQHAQVRPASKTSDSNQRLWKLTSVKMMSDPVLVNQLCLISIISTMYFETKTLACNTVLSDQGECVRAVANPRHPTPTPPQWRKTVMSVCVSCFVLSNACAVQLVAAAVNIWL